MLCPSSPSCIGRQRCASGFACGCGWRPLCCVSAAHTAHTAAACLSLQPEDMHLPSTTHWEYHWEATKLVRHARLLFKVSPEAACNEERALSNRAWLQFHQFGGQAGDLWPSCLVRVPRWLRCGLLRLCKRPGVFCLRLLMPYHPALYMSLLEPPAAATSDPTWQHPGSAGPTVRLQPSPPGSGFGMQGHQLCEAVRSATAAAPLLLPSTDEQYTTRCWVKPPACLLTRVGGGYPRGGPHRGLAMSGAANRLQQRSAWQQQTALNEKHTTDSATGPLPDRRQGGAPTGGIACGENSMPLLVMTISSYCCLLRVSREGQYGLLVTPHAVLPIRDVKYTYGVYTP
jgi:hypothetical protein